MQNGTLIIELFEAKILNESSVLGKLNSRAVFSVNVFKARSSTIQDGGKNPKWKGGEVFSVRARLDDYLNIELLNDKQSQGNIKIKIDDLPIKKPIWIDLSSYDQGQQKKSGKIALQFEFYPDNQYILNKLESAQLIGNINFKDYESSQNLDMSVDDLSLEVNKLKDEKANLQQVFTKQVAQLKEEQEKVNQIQQTMQQLQKQEYSQQQKLSEQQEELEQLRVQQKQLLNGITGQIEFSNLSANLVRNVEIVGQKMDPYIRFTTLSGVIKSDVLDSAHLTPKWPKSYSIQLQNENFVYIEIWDKNPIKDEIIGYGYLDLIPLLLNDQVQSFKFKMYYFKYQNAGEFLGNLQIKQI